MKTDSSDYPLEFQVILACARRAYSGGRLDLGSVSLDRVDWNVVVNAGVYHKLGAIVHDGLASMQPSPLPAHLRLLLGRKEQEDRSRSHALTREIQGLTTILEANSLRYLTYKGAIAAHLIYDDPHLRRSLDIDLLIPESSREAVTTLLRTQGFVCAESPERQQCLKQSTLVHPERRASVDLHWSLVPGYLHLKDRLVYPFERPWRVRIAGALLPTLTPELMLLDFCLQGAKERWRNLSRIVDVAGFVAVHSREVDWTHLNGMSVRTGLDRVVEVGLGIAERLFPSALSEHGKPVSSSSRQVRGLIDEAIDRFRDVDDAARRAVQQLPQNAGGDPDQWWSFVSREPQAWLTYLPNIASHRADRFRILCVSARYYMKRAFTIYEHDRRAIRLPRLLEPLHLVLKPIRLIIKYTIGAAGIRRS